MMKKLLMLAVILVMSVTLGAYAAAAPVDDWAVTDEGAKVWLLGKDTGETV